MTDTTPHPIVLRIGREEITLRRRYEILSIANDILIGLWFLVGSFLFFGASSVTAGTWLFVIGSVEMLIRPAIRLARHIHISRVGGPGAETASDF